MTPRHRVFQTSTISSLASGVFDDDITIGELLGHGSFGIGTFNKLDGEMVIIEGRCFQMRIDGTLVEASNTDHTPYAMVTNFVPTYRQELQGDMLRSSVSEIIDRLVPSPNYLYAVRISGEFSWVSTRAVERQERPYPSLVDATHGEDVTTFEELSGTLVGFRTPEFGANLSVPGCHVHFIDSDRTRGGHVVDFEMKRGIAEVCVCTDLELRLPLTEDFQQAHLTPEDLDEQLARAEHARGPV